jgi:polyhydroxyalkanoate synthase
MTLLLDYHPPWVKATMPSETATERLDRLLHTWQAQRFGGLSPVSLGLAWADWVWHLALSPGRQMELIARMTSLLQQSCQPDLPLAAKRGMDDEDPRFRHDAWTQWPFCQIRTAFRKAEHFWFEAAETAGMTAHHRQMTRFFAKQWLDMLSPANGVFTNPVVLHDVIQSQGTHLLHGLLHALEDGLNPSKATAAASAPGIQVGKNVACTPGVVVFRNALIELIRYQPQTEQVYPEPILIIPSWIMKYYILDLSPHNSMVRYLVQQGHTVYLLSWRNPQAQDHDLSMDDYLRLGVLDALNEVGTLSHSNGVHAVGYCLGGTLLAIAAAALSSKHGVSRARHLPPLRSLTLMAAQTDFTEPGELGLFIDASQIEYLRNQTRGTGYLSGTQMAGSFQFLHSRDLFWTRRMRSYLLGEREPGNDLMAWNADTTRMPARMHHEYLTSLYLNNALAANAYEVEDRSVSLGDIKAPLFLVATQRDHISPWRSVYKLHHLCDAEITFVLTTGGHNAGIVSEPGHANRAYQIATRPAYGAWEEPDHWLEHARQETGSWWPAWQAWLAQHSGSQQDAQNLATEQNFGYAPGTYVFQRYPD